MGSKGNSPSRLRRQPALNNSLRHAGGETVPPEAAEGVLLGCLPGVGAFSHNVHGFFLLLPQLAFTIKAKLGVPAQERGRCDFAEIFGKRGERYGIWKNSDRG